MEVGEGPLEMPLSTVTSGGRYVEIHDNSSSASARATNVLPGEKVSRESRRRESDESEENGPQNGRHGSTEPSPVPGEPRN